MKFSAWGGGGSAAGHQDIAARVKSAANLFGFLSLLVLGLVVARVRLLCLSPKLTAGTATVTAVFGIVYLWIHCLDLISRGPPAATPAPEQAYEEAGPKWQRPIRRRGRRREQVFAEAVPPAPACAERPPAPARALPSVLPARAIRATRASRSTRVVLVSRLSTLFLVRVLPA